ncbi:unnamed protein product, partial [Allacma fusca]
KKSNSDQANEITELRACGGMLTRKSQAVFEVLTTTIKPKLEKVILKPQPTEEEYHCVENNLYMFSHMICRICQFSQVRQRTTTHRHLKQWKDLEKIDLLHGNSVEDLQLDSIFRYICDRRLSKDKGTGNHLHKLNTLSIYCKPQDGTMDYLLGLNFDHIRPYAKIRKTIVNGEIGILLQEAFLLH